MLVWRSLRCIHSYIVYFFNSPIPQVNHLSHFLITLELLPILLESASQTGDSRIVIVSSSLYALSSWEPANLNGEQEYNRLMFYPKSKLYNVSAGYNNYCVFTELFGEYEMWTYFSCLDNDSLCITEETTWCQDHCLNCPSWLSKHTLHIV